MNDGVPILFLLGSSGAGKSRLGQWIAEDLDFFWIEIDRWPDGDGIDLTDLRAEWDALWNTCEAGATVAPPLASPSQYLGIPLKDWFQHVEAANMQDRYTFRAAAAD